MGEKIKSQLHPVLLLLPVGKKSAIRKLWRKRKKGVGIMKLTKIKQSKYNDSKEQVQFLVEFAMFHLRTLRRSSL